MIIIRTDPHHPLREVGINCNKLLCDRIKVEGVNRIKVGIGPIKSTTRNRPTRVVTRAIIRPQSVCEEGDTQMFPRRQQSVRLVAAK